MCLISFTNKYSSVSERCYSSLQQSKQTDIVCTAPMHLYRLFLNHMAVIQSFIIPVSFHNKLELISHCICQDSDTEDIKKKLKHAQMSLLKKFS